MEKSNKIAAVAVLGVVCISTLFKWYVFEVDNRTNLILAIISIFVLSSTVIFFRKLYAYFDKVLPYDSGITRRLVLQIVITFIFVSTITQTILYIITHIF